MSYYTNAFTDDDPYWACYYGVSTHPKYRQCDRCPSKLRCDMSITSPKPEIKPDELPCKGKGNCLNCPCVLEPCPLFNA